MLKVLASSFMALLLSLFLCSLALAGEPPDTPLFAPSPAPPEPPLQAITLRYAQVVKGAAPVYGAPSDQDNGIPPSRWLADGFVFVSLADTPPVQYGGRTWIPLNGGGFVAANQIASYKPSAFRGIEIFVPPTRPFAWIIGDTYASTQPGAAPVKGAPKIAHYTRVEIYAEQTVAGVRWYRIAEEEWVSQFRVGIVTPTPRPAGVGPGEKWIDVNLFEQTFAAYEGDTMKYASLVSSGLPQWATAPGLFRVWGKARLTPMSGRDGLPDYYYLPDVPWVLYFNHDTALHTAYWHDDFGHVHSHGCVNLAPEDALWLYNWAMPSTGPNNWSISTKDNPGTWVRVRRN